MFWQALVSTVTQIFFTYRIYICEFPVFPAVMDSWIQHGTVSGRKWIVPAVFVRLLSILNSIQSMLIGLIRHH
jgi:hypothetical protein